MQIVSADCFTTLTVIRLSYIERDQCDVNTKMDHAQSLKQQKYLYFVRKLVEFICDAVPSYQMIFPDRRTKYWDSLLSVTLDRILQRIVQHTPCHILSQAFSCGLLTVHNRIHRIVSHTLRSSEKSQARCLALFLDSDASKLQFTIYHFW